MLNNRKSIVFVGAATAGVIMLASAAFACTTFKGRWDVTAGGGTSQAWGANSGMAHCSAASGYAPTSNATLPTSGGTVTVGAYPTTAGSTGCSTSQLSASKNGNPFPRHYYVHYVNRNGFVSSSGVWVWSVDCMASSGGRLNAADGGGNEIWINSSGNSTIAGSTTTAGTRQYTVPSGQTANSTTDRAGVCISDTGDGQGNQTPLQIVSI